MLTTTVPQPSSSPTSSSQDTFSADHYSYNKLSSIDIYRFGSGTFESPASYNGKTTPKISISQPSTAVYTTIAQWEGTVEEVLPDGSVVAHLRALALVGEAAPASSEGFEEWATIPQSQIEPEDIRYARAGATFYLTVAKLKREGALLGGTSVVIVFRKVPIWNRSQVEIYRQRAAELYSRIHEQSRSKMSNKTDKPRPELPVTDKPRSFRVII
ncbi:hypothetical protein [Burkholderia gladioli]|uniref:hypothetical protein n=1 Tax=Burkholderia gladioli TaxID=28095 RepID=UPI001640D33D|nr:hypothetical protein [Burkholderia gladioli]